MTDLLTVEVEEIAGEQQPSDRSMGPNTFLSLVSNMVTDAQNWLQNDVSGSWTRAQRYYQGESDVERDNDLRSGFVMREVRDAVEQAVPQIMKIFTGGEYLVRFKAKDVNDQAQAAAADATEAFNTIFFKRNEGWLRLQEITRDALKAKIGVLKVYQKEEWRVRQVEYRGTMAEFELLAADEAVEVDEFRSFTEMVQGIMPITGQPMVQTVEMVDATLTVKHKEGRIAIEARAPEEFLINRSATGTRFGEFNMIGERCVKTVADAVNMGIPFETAEKWAGTGDGSATGDYPDQVRRARREMSRDPYQEQVHHDPAVQPLTIYELYIMADKDGDGIAELRRVVALGEDVGEIVDDQIVEDHPYCVGSAIQTEHSVIGESMADNLMDIQDVQTQQMRNLLNNMGYVNNPRPIVGRGVTLEHVLDNRLGFPIGADDPRQLGWLQWPSILPDVLPIMEMVDRVKQGRTGISNESQGLDAKNLQASSEVGVLAILGAGMTQPEMIAANLAHSCIAQAAEKTIALLRQTNEPLDIVSKSDQQEMTPAQWPDSMETEVCVGLGTGTREERLAALYQLKATIERTFQAALAATGSLDNPWFTEEQYSQVNHSIAELSKLGQSTKYMRAPEEVQHLVDMQKRKKAATPTQPSEEDKKRAADMAEEQLKSQTTLEKQRMADETDITQTIMDNEAKREEVYLEAALSREQGSEVDLG